MEREMQRKEAAVRIAVLVKTAGLSPLHAAQLVKAANDAAAVRARMEKDAGLWDTLGRGAGKAYGAVRSMFGGGAPRPPGPPVPPGLPPIPTRASVYGAPRPPMPPPPPGLRPPPPGGGGFSPFGQGMRFSPLRTAAAAGGLAVGGQHLVNDADSTVGRSANPLTWLNPQSAEAVYTRSSGLDTQARSGIEAELAAAHAAGDLGKVRELSGRIQRGDYGGPQSPRFDENGQAVGNWNPLRSRMWGLNPWAEQSGDVHQRAMLAAQRALHGEYAGARGQGATPADPAAVRRLEQQLRSPDLLPAQAASLERELAMLRDRMSRPAGAETPASEGVLARMRAAGMRLPHGVGGPPPGGGGGGGGASVPWSYGRRPAMPANLAALTGQPLLSNEFRPAPQPWDYQGAAAPGPFVHNGS